MKYTAVVLAFLSFLFVHAQDVVQHDTVDILNDIYLQHIQQLEGINNSHDPFMILFSGTPGMGKTFLARIIEDTFGAVRISNDSIRKIIDSRYQLIKQEREKIVRSYLPYFFSRYDFPNKFFVFDASIDRGYVALFPILRLFDIPWMVIRLVVPHDTLMKRLQQKESHPSNPYYLKYISLWLSDYEKFAQNYDDYIEFENRDGADYSCLLDQISARLISGAQTSVVLE